ARHRPRPPGYRHYAANARDPLSGGRACRRAAAAGKAHPEGAADRYARRQLLGAPADLPAAAGWHHAHVRVVLVRPRCRAPSLCRRQAARGRRMGRTAAAGPAGAARCRGRAAAAAVARLSGRQRRIGPGRRSAIDDAQTAARRSPDGARARLVQRPAGAFGEQFGRATASRAGGRCPVPGHAAAERQSVARPRRGGGEAPHRRDRPPVARRPERVRPGRCRAGVARPRGHVAAPRRLRRRGPPPRRRGRHRERPVMAPAAPSRHLESFIEMLRAERNAARNTVEAYTRDLSDLAGFLARRRAELATADAAALRAYLAALDRAGMAPRTAARRLSAIRQFYRFLVGEGLRQDDPVATIDAPRQGRPLPKLLSEVEVGRLLEAAHAMKGADGLRLATLLELLYATGLRVSELVALPVAAVMRDQRVLIVRGKGGKERMIPLHESARAAITAWLAARSAELRKRAKDAASSWLFPSHGDSGHLTRQRLGQLLK